MNGCSQEFGRSESGRGACLLACFAFYFGSQFLLIADPIDKLGQAHLKAPLNTEADGPIKFELKFHSVPSAFSQLPGSWSIPQLDSRVELINEREFKVYYPDGGSEILDYVDRRRSDSEPERIGVRVEGKSVEISKEGVTYLFNEGRLSKWKTPNGDLFAWNRLTNSNPEIQKLTLNGADLVEVTRRKSGPVGELSMNFIRSGSSAFVSYDNVSNLIDKDYVFSGLGGFATVRKVTFSNGETIEIVPEKAGVCRRLQISGWPGHESLDIFVDENGVLKSFNGIRYEAEWMEGQAESHVIGAPLIVAYEKNVGPRVVQNGFFYPRRNVKNVFSPDWVEEEYFLDTPTGKRLQKRILNGEEIYRGYFDKEGRKIRQITNGRVINIVDGEIAESAK